MAKLKINPLGNHIEIPHGDHNVTELVSQFLLQANIPNEDKIRKGVVVYLNGKELDACFWDRTTPNEKEDVLISFKLEGGEFGQNFKLVATIAIVIAASVLAPGAGTAAAAWASAAIYAGAVVAIMTLNALIPPLPPEGYGSDGGIGDYSRSQMYSISGQSNQLKKYAAVPKVYGTHRVYPTIAATPYTELDAGPDGKLAQYFYCVYDLGLGPNNVRDIRIGDTPIESYNEASYSVVDFNKPETSEGVWDTLSSNTLTWYKGIRVLDSFGLPLNGAIEDGDPESSYRFERNSSSNAGQQRITLTFRAPGGIYSLGSNGAYGRRHVDLRFSYKMEGESVWRSFSPFYSPSSILEVKGDVSSSTYTRPLNVTQISNPKSSYSEISSSRIYTAGEIPNIPFYEGRAARPRGWSEYNSGESEDLSKTGGYLLSMGHGLSLLENTPIGVNEKIYIYGNFYADGGGIFETQDYGWYANLLRNFSKPTPIYQVVKYWNHKVENWGYWYPETRSETPPDLRDGRVIKKTFDGDTVRLSGNTADEKYFSVSFTPVLPGRCLVRVDRIRNFGDYTYSIRDELVVESLSSMVDSDPIVTDKRHSFLEIKMRATDQLNGTIQNLTAVTSSVLDTWNGSAWVKQETNNPAWIFCDILTGQINKRAIDKSKLDMTSIVAWANYCNEVPTPPDGKTYSYKRYEQNFYMDYLSTVQSLISQVTNSCQAGLNISDGKYGVIIDKLKTTPVQIFTPRNYSNFSASRNMVALPHGIKVKFIDRLLNWSVSEMVVYFDGYDEDTATEFEEVETFGVTNSEQAFRYGKYLMAQTILRKETISIEVDFEHLVCTRGDYVQITSDVMKAGGHPARVKSVSGSNITLDDGFEIDPLENYSYIFRSTSGILSGTIDMTASDAGTILSGNIPSEGDLIVISESTTQTFDCIVKSITPSDNLKATLTLVEKADGIYTAESDSTFPVYNPFLNATQNLLSLTPGPILNPTVLENTWECFGGRYQYYATLSWENPPNSIFERFEVYANYGSGYSLDGITQANTYKYIFDSSKLNIEHSFKVLAVSVTGLKIPMIEATSFTATPTIKSTRPSDVARIDLNITLESMTLEWQRIDDCDADEYLIRYSPLADAIWEESIPLTRVDSNTSSITQMARTGTYLIKAVDWNGTESLNAAKSSTTIPELFNLNFIEEINDFPALEGSFDKAYSDSTSIIIQEKTIGGVGTNEYYPEGYYYYKNLLDLGEPYTVRLQSLIQAQGYTTEDLMLNWETLDSVTAMAGSQFDEWDVETQVRTRDTFVSIASWDNLEDVLAMNAGEEGDWSEWRKFTIGDFTGRYFQFRLKLISNKASVSPRVFAGVIKADMPDRIDTYNNITSGVGEYDLVYDAKFMGPTPTPNIQITQDNMQTGDRFVITNKTLNGFTIQFFDKDNNTVSRTFDCSVRGYGRLAPGSL